MHTRVRYIPIVEAEVGMVLAASVSLTSNGLLSIKLARGHALTANCINQLVVHGAEHISISEPDIRTADQIAFDHSAALLRVQSIFHGADLDDPTTAALYNQVKIYRGSL